jgi:transposase-like protein/ribosomal protein L37AE/L43A
MNLFGFNQRFPDEAACENYLRLKREEEGIVCSKCHESKHYWTESLKRWKCANCGMTENLMAGTMMEKTKVSLKIWFQVIHLMTSTKKAFSALEMQRQVETKFYEPIWYMMQKIRITMGKRDTRYKLQGDIEIDDAFFETVDLPKEFILGGMITEQHFAKGGLTRGRGSERQSKVLVMVESKPNPLQTLKYKKDRIMGFAKMIVMDDLTGVGINYVVKESISPSSIVISDGYRSYSGLSEIVEQHNAMVVPAKEAHKKLPWVHATISNAKRNLLGVHHSIGKGFLQNYLNEFVYKLNRRTFDSDLFDRMIVAGAHDTWY